MVSAVSSVESIDSEESAPSMELAASVQAVSRKHEAMVAKES
jgi:hypothetical protein